MQVLRTIDALRCLLLNVPRGLNQAVPEDRIIGQVWRVPLPFELLRETALQHRQGCTLVSWKALRLQALASLRARSGPRAWEVHRLYLPLSSKTEVVEILEHTIHIAGERGAERVFLRVLSGNPVIDMARATGFVPGFTVSLLQASYRARPRSGDMKDATTGGARGDPPLSSRPNRNISLRPKIPADEYATFQLYSASTPVTIRSILGITFDQWRDARGATKSRTLELVCEGDTRLRAWIRLRRYSTVTIGELLVRPDEADILPELVECLLTRWDVQSWLVHQYQEPLHNLLIRQGFEEVEHYSTLVKPLAAKVKSSFLAPVEA